MTLKQQLTQPRTLGITGGILGAFAMIVAEGITTSGPLQAAPLVVVLIAVLILFTRLQPKTTFRQLKGLALATSLTTMLFYAAYVRLIEVPEILSFTEYLSMLGIVIFVSVISSLVAAGLVQLMRS